MRLLNVSLALLPELDQYRTTIQQMNGPVGRVTGGLTGV
jgi:hypothetical protein